MRKYYIKFKNLQALPAQLSWSHVCELLNLKNLKELNYYIYIIKTQNLSYRELHNKIKSKRI